MIEVIDSNKNELTFVVRGINASFANAIRRSSNEVPILAVDTVEISKNDSALYDEILAHRIGLIPLKTDKTFTLPEECSCKDKGCAKCTANLTLKITGPCMVRAKDLKSKTLEPIFPEMPITLLQKDQEIELVCEARLGKGLSHAKYSPGLLWFRNYPNIEIAKDCEGCEECAKACPRNVFDVSGKTIKVKNLLNCDLCNACVEACAKKGNDMIKVNGSESDFIFEVESWGQIPAKEIFKSALDVLSSNLKELEKELERL